MSPPQKEQRVELRRETLEMVEEFYGEAVSLIRELTTDLKRFYVPEMGWPPHIEAGSDLGDHEECLREIAAALFQHTTPKEGSE